jgi:tetratricopeptide (TPR) repeat protein
MEAITPAAEALELFDRSDRRRDAILAGYWLAYAQYLADNAAEARSILRMLLDRVRAGVEVESDVVMRLLTAAAYVETWDGKHQRAVTYLEEARGLTRDVDDRRRASFLSALASAYLHSGDIEGAVRTGSQSIALYRAFEAEHEVALVANNLANAYLAVGNLGRASELAAEAHREHEGVRGSRELATVLDTEARIKLAGGDTNGAIELAERAMAAAKAVDNQRALADAQLTLAQAATAEGRNEDAIRFYEGAAELLRASGSGLRLVTVLTEWADLLAAGGDHEQAYALTREALRRGEH